MMLCDKLREYYFGQGLEYDCADYFGSHKDSDGYIFRVWAPNADSVKLVGDFSGWKDGVSMQKSDCGVWACRLTDTSFGDGSKYKYLITRGKKSVYKADPFAFYSECREHTASRFCDIACIENFDWTDADFKASQSDNRIYFHDDKAVPKPMNIYELHAGSWRRHPDGSEYTWHELADELSEYLPEMGYTHLELMPITEYPFDGSWGYQVTGYFAPTSRYGTPSDFASFVNKMHSVGIGVFLDWVPAHFTKDEHGLYEFDGGPLYEYQGKDRQENRGWGTRCFDLGRSEVRSFLISSAIFWLQKYHIDGLRVDAVASMLYLDYGRLPGEWNPNPDGTNINYDAVEFFGMLSHAVHERCPDAYLIAEESTAFPNVTKRHGLGFNLKWNMGWMNDTLAYIQSDPYFRSGCHHNMTFAMSYAFSENYLLPISHDEVVHGKKSLLDKCNGDYGQKFDTLRAYMIYMMTHPGKKLLFMGCEFAPFSEWNESTSLEWFMLGYDRHNKFRDFVKTLNHFYLASPALWQNDGSWDGFEWIYADRVSDNVYAYKRRADDGRELIIVLNFAAKEYKGYGIPVKSGRYRILLSSDDARFGGAFEGEHKETRAKKTADGIFLPLDLPALSGQIIELCPTVKKSAVNKKQNQQN